MPDEAVQFIPDEIIPAKDSEGVGVAITKMLEEILSYREEVEFGQRCTRFYKLRRNKHWKYENKDLNLLSGNLLGSHHQKSVNMLTDNNPTFNAVQAGDMGEDGQDKLSLLENMTDSWWIDTEQQSVLEESVHVGELYALVGEMMHFDLDINYPHGEVATDTLDPLYFSLYPPKCRKVNKAEGFVRWDQKTVREARRLWPHVAEEIQSDVSLLQDIGDNRDDDTTPNSSSKTQVVINSVRKWIGGEKKGSDDDSDDLFIITVWVKDYSENEDGTPVYPGNIRRIRACNGGDLVLDDEYNPSLNPELPEEVLQQNYYYNRFPVSYTQPVADPASPFGLADFEQLEKLNMEVNKAMTQFTMFKDKASRLKLLNPRDSGVQDSELDTTSGILHPTNHLVAQAIKYIDPPQMGNDIPNAVALYKDMFNEIAGSFNDVMQGQKQGSEVIAAKAIAMLLEEAARMARGKIRNYSKMLRERGRGFIALAQMWYDTPRFITFQKKGEDVNIGVTRDMLQIPGKINVVSGSTMPVSMIQRREEVLSLAQGGFVDQEYVLESFNIDNYKDVIERMQQGPLGQFLQKLGMTGVPKEVLGLFEQIGKMDDKELERAIKEGKIPPFMQIVQQMAGQQQPEQPNPDVMKLQLEGRKLQIDEQKAQAEIQKIMASAQKEQAGVALIQEQIATEQQDRQIAVAELEIKREGLGLDKDNMRITKAKAISDIQNSKKDRDLDKTKTIADIAVKSHQEKMDLHDRKDPGKYEEKGMKSNNKELK